MGEKAITDIKYGEIAAILGGHPWGSTKTRNNVLSVLRRVFEFAHLDETIDKNPTEKLKSMKVQRQPPDPYTVQEVEGVIQRTREVWGDFEANYVEFAFFTGCPNKAGLIDAASAEDALAKLEAAGFTDIEYASAQYARDALAALTVTLIRLRRSSPPQPLRWPLAWAESRQRK